MRRREGRLLFVLLEIASYETKKDTSHCDVSYRAGKET